MARPLVQIVGLSLAAAGCHHDPAAPPDIHYNPPPPDIHYNPPAPDTTLPTWDSIVSGHPVGATNPPMPLLVVARDTGACFKDWLPGMIPPPREIMDARGRVVETMAQATGTQVQCPEGEPAGLLARWDAATSVK